MKILNLIVALAIISLAEMALALDPVCPIQYPARPADLTLIIGHCRVKGTNKPVVVYTYRGEDGEITFGSLLFEFFNEDCSFVSPSGRNPRFNRDGVPLNKKALRVADSNRLKIQEGGPALFGCHQELFDLDKLTRKARLKICRSGGWHNEVISKINVKLESCVLDTAFIEKASQEGQ